MSIYPHEDGDLTLKERWELVKMVVGWKLIVAAAVVDVTLVAFILYLVFNN